MTSQIRMPRMGVILGLLLLLASPGPGFAQEVLTVDPGIPSYEPVDGVEGTLISVGSDTLNNLMALWSEGFRSYYPHVQFEIEGKGSSTAPPALIAGTAQLGRSEERRGGQAGGQRRAQPTAQ